MKNVKNKQYKYVNKGPKLGENAFRDKAYKMATELQALFDQNKGQGILVIGIGTLDQRDGDPEPGLATRVLVSGENPGNFFTVVQEINGTATKLAIDLGLVD